MTNTLAVLILPGHLCNSRLFSYQIDALRNLAEVTIADLYRYDDIAMMAASIIKDMPHRFAVLANSMGGAVAFEIVRQCSERVIGLALVGTTARPESRAQRKFRQVALKLAQEGNFKAIAEIYAPLFFHPGRMNHCKNKQILETMIIEAGLEGLRVQQKAFSTRPNSLSTLLEVDCPTAVICGRQDAITPLEMSKEIAETIPGAELEIVENCGHIPMLEWPDKTELLFRKWLNRII